MSERGQGVKNNSGRAQWHTVLCRRSLYSSHILLRRGAGFVCSPPPPSWVMRLKEFPAERYSGALLPAQIQLEPPTMCLWMCATGWQKEQDDLLWGDALILTHGQQQQLWQKARKSHRKRHLSVRKARRNIISGIGLLWHCWIMRCCSATSRLFIIIQTSSLYMEYK